MAQSKLDVGTKVQNKTDNRRTLMIVVEVDGDLRKCEWFKDNKRHADSFHVAALEPYDEDGIHV